MFGLILWVCCKFPPWNDPLPSSKSAPKALSSFKEILAYLWYFFLPFPVCYHDSLSCAFSLLRIYTFGSGFFFLEIFRCDVLQHFSWVCTDNQIWMVEFYFLLLTFDFWLYFVDVGSGISFQKLGIYGSLVTNSPAGSSWLGWNSSMCIWDIQFASCCS